MGKILSSWLGWAGSATLVLAQIPNPNPSPAPAFFPNQPAVPPANPMLPQFRPQPQPLGQPPVALPPAMPLPPQMLPQSIVPNQPQGVPGTQAPAETGEIAGNSEIKLPSPEIAMRFDANSLGVRRMTNSWQIWSGTRVFRDFGSAGEDANEAARAIRELRPTDWVVIGGSRPVVEYGLTNGKAHIPTFPPKSSRTIDLNSVRAEAVRGVWVLRDDANILLNFGNQRSDAEQAAAVCKRYGFNRLGQIGSPVPSLSYFFALPGRELNVGKPLGGNPAVSAAFQEQNLQRTGIDVPGVGFIGERLVIDSKKLELRKDKSSEWVIAHGPDTIARFGSSEWSARDGLKILQDMRVTEFCRVNADVSFFLIHGAPPNRVPFSVQATRFELETLKVRAADNGKFAIYEGVGRQLFPVASKEEGEALIRLLKHFKFDQVCQLGLSARSGLKFLAKAGR
jgi:hypothetical protein